ncbi:MAG: HAD hydrolase family protein [Desulfofustis sp.]|jgi:3-deoxy-D-manno-octulosonate 8-phosphate phosphatase (KDO 8-P phosphatase)
MTDDAKHCASGGPHPSDCEILAGYRRRSREKNRPLSEEQRVVFAKAEPIRLLLLDVDGVLTDGRLYYSDEGVESKAFCTQDGLGIRLLQRAEVMTGLITARTSRLVAWRGEELDMNHIRQGVSNKLEEFKSILNETSLKPYQVCYMGDDLIDLSLLTRVGLAACPANAVEEVKEACHFIARRPGGAGAVREICDLIIRAKGLHDTLLQQFL